MPAVRHEIETAQGLAWVDLERPAGSPSAILFFGHGAGGGVGAPDINAAAGAAIGAGLLVARITQPYRVAGRRTPVPAPRLDEAWLESVGFVRARRGLRTLPVVFGGRSSGARVACRTAAAGAATAVIALAFPEHPPGKPERTRIAEIDAVDVPTLVVQGERDPFGMPPSRSATGGLRTVVVIAGDDHGLKRDTGAIGAAVTEFLSGVGIGR